MKTNKIGKVKKKIQVPRALIYIIFSICLCIFLGIFTGCISSDNVREETTSPESKREDVNDNAETEDKEKHPLHTDQNQDVGSFETENLEFTTKNILYYETLIQHGYQFRKDMDVVVINGVTFAFEKSIAMLERRDCIKKTGEILQIIGRPNGLEIYIYKPDTFNSTYVSGSAVYTHSQDYEGVDYISSVLLGVFGEYCNYGMTCGYAACIGNYLWETPIDLTVSKIDSSWEYFDLNYLCFNEDFVNKEDIEIAKEISNRFVWEYISSNGADAFEKLLSYSGDVYECKQFNEILYAYYASQDIDANISPILYKFGGKGNQYIAECKYATFCVPYEFDDLLNVFYQEVYDGFLNKDYKKTDEFFRVNSNQMEESQRLFGLEQYENDLYIIFQNAYGNIHFGTKYYKYGDGNRCVIAPIIASLTHVYMYSLIEPLYENENAIGDSWAISGLLKYFSWKYDFYGCIMYYEDYASTVYGKMYSEKVGRPLDLSTDFGVISDMITYLSGQKIDPNFSPATGASFIHYLVKTYGEQETIDYILVNCDLSTLTDKSFDEVVADWKEYLKNNYSEYKE